MSQYCPWIILATTDCVFSIKIFGKKKKWWVRSWTLSSGWISVYWSNSMNPHKIYCVFLCFGTQRIFNNHIYFLVYQQMFKNVCGFMFWILYSRVKDFQNTQKNTNKHLNHISGSEYSPWAESLFRNLMRRSMSS